MIGFRSQLHSEKAKPDEGPETRHLEKKELYECLAHINYLVPYNSKGLTREYLVGVFKEKFLRVPLIELKQFEVSLTPKMTRRVGMVNNSLLVRKLQKLLAEKNLPELGFSEVDPPDQTWLYRVLRFLDPTNLTEFFEEPVRQEPNITSASSKISRVHIGRFKASAYFFRIKSAQSNKQLWEDLRVISDTYRNYQSQSVTLELLRRELRQLEQKKDSLAHQLDDLISKCAFTYTSLENPKIKADMIINSSEAITKEIRDKIALNSQM